MSRINKALSRASDSTDPANTAPRASLHPASGETTLAAFAPETGPTTAEGEAPSSLLRAVVAPRAGARRQLSPLDATHARKLVAEESLDRISREQYRRLAGVLHEFQVERGLKTLMVTSALPGDGKTLTVANLALPLSESFKRRVLLIDADLRRPTVHQVLGLPNAAGLSDVLRSGRPELPLLTLSDTLTVLPAGKSDGAQMAGLVSDRMRLLLERFADEFEWVLLDAAPVGLMPDARLLAGLTRAVLFVIGAGSTPYHLVTRALNEIGRECVVGTVLNRVDLHNVPATAYYDRYYADALRASEPM